MAAKIVVADATIDGTTDFKPLRGKQYDIRKTHISETPITLKNWYKHIDWLNTTFILLIHFAAMIAAYWVPLRLNTLIFALVYYFNTGLGITAGKHQIFLRFPSLSLPNFGGSYFSPRPGLLPQAVAQRLSGVES